MVWVPHVCVLGEEEEEEEGWVSERRPADWCGLVRPRTRRSLPPADARACS